MSEHTTSHFDESKKEFDGEQKAPLISQNVLAVVFLVVSILTFLFVTRSAQAGLSADSKHLDELNTEKQSVEAKLVQLQEAQRTLDLDSEVKTNTLINAIPSNLDQDDLIRDLVGLAKSNDIEFQSINFSLSGDSDAEVKQVTVSASFEGNYSDLIRFLKAVEDNGRKLVVDNISVQLLGEAINGIERVHFSLTMVGFYRNGI